MTDFVSVINNCLAPCCCFLSANSSIAFFTCSTVISLLPFEATFSINSEIGFVLKLDPFFISFKLKLVFNLISFNATVGLSVNLTCGG